MEKEEKEIKRLMAGMKDEKTKLKQKKLLKLSRAERPTNVGLGSQSSVQLGQPYLKKSKFGLMARLGKVEEREESGRAEEERVLQEAGRRLAEGQESRA